MTVTAISPLTPRGQRPAARPTTKRRVTRRSDPDAAVTLTFDVTLIGERRHRDALDLIDGLHQLAEELGARVNITAGQPGPAAAPALAAVPGPGWVVVHAESRGVRLGTDPVIVTRVEYDLLQFLAEHPRQVFTRRQLLQSVWGHQHAGERTVDVHIRRLRAKLGEELVTTVRGIGYRLADDAPIQVIHPPRKGTPR